AAQRVVGAKASHGAPASDEAGHGASRVAAHGSHDAGNPAATPVTTGDFSAFAYDEEGRATEEVPEYLYKSRRMRRILIVAIILLALVVAGLIYFGVQLFKEGNSLGIQQALSTEQQTAEIKPDEAQDASTSTAKVTTVPDLVSLLGLTQEEAVTVLQHGAQVSSTRAVNEEGNPIKTEARVALTAEPADSRTGTPTVYLGLDEAGKIIQAGYSASTTALGYGSLSFADAVRNEDIIQKTLAEAGVAVPEGAVELPEDSTAYTTVDSDGKTVTKEYCSFSGEADVEGASHTWSAVLSYDYSMANASGNLADTVRTIFIYVNA
ncbi:histone-lysine N-methyltransferase, partial [uncultured Adlercreutzia sp.]|uniref:histone-lysine N-methyltransferase n=1 Tax=uncultured Adlercreutzia sp. TaxID=875803 RepID=UPI0025A563F9